jgi:uncharacterized membrane protein YgdD (TMEM256/DUF423 family)
MPATRRLNDLRNISRLRSWISEIERRVGQEAAALAAAPNATVLALMPRRNLSAALRGRLADHAAIKPNTNWPLSSPTQSMRRNRRAVRLAGSGAALMATTILLVLAGMMGASGIILAAAGAHAAPGAGLDSAASMLLFHAVAVLGGAALMQQAALWRPLALAALAAWVVGAFLFSGDIALRTFAGHRLFPMATPSGGLILTAGWLLLVAAAIGALLRS